MNEEKNSKSIKVSCKSINIKDDCIEIYEKLNVLLNKASDYYNEDDYEYLIKMLKTSIKGFEKYIK